VAVGDADDALTLMARSRDPAVAEVSPFAAKDRTFKTVRPESGNRQRDCSDPQTAVDVNHQDRPG